MRRALDVEVDFAEVLTVLGRCVAWISYLNISMLIGTLSIALFNASKDEIAKNMAYAYAAISVGIMVRLTLSFRSTVVHLRSSHTLFGLLRSMDM